MKAKRISRWWWAAALLVVLGGAAALAGSKWARWIWPVAPFHLIGPVDYVGTRGLASYLIRTPQGAILLDAPLQWNVAAIERSIAARGVRLRDVKLILLSHAHFDHAGGLAALQRATGAQIIVGAADRAAVETGVPPGETHYGVIGFDPVRVARGVRDGDVVELGGVRLTAVATPGHTPGCTSWQMQTPVDGRPLTILFACSLEVAGNKLVDNRRYPGIVADFRRSFDRLGAMRPDVLLTFHPERSDLFERVERGVLIDRDRLPRLATRARRDFETQLREEQRR